MIKDEVTQVTQHLFVRPLYDTIFLMRIRLDFIILDTQNFEHLLKYRLELSRVIRAYLIRDTELSHMMHECPCCRFGRQITQGTYANIPRARIYDY